MALDRLHAMIRGRLSFPFGSDLFCLFFERFSEMRPTFNCRPPRMMNEVWIHMWGEMIPKRAQPKYLARISPEALQLLASEADHMFIMVSCTYAGMDWKQCPNILFTEAKPADGRVNINVFFKFI